MNYQENLRYLRLHGEKVNALPEREHLSKAKMELYESGRVSAPLAQLEKIASYYGVSLHDLLFVDMKARDKPSKKALREAAAEAKRSAQQEAEEQKTNDQLQRIHELQAQRIHQLETVIKRYLPDLANELGIH